MTLYCGAARVEINPKMGTPLSGYAAERRAGRVHDNLYAKIAVLKLNETSLVMVNLDLICVDHIYVNGLREKIKQQYNIPKEYVMIHASHTHSGPGGAIHNTSPVYKAFSDVWKKYDETVVREQHRKILNAVSHASATLEPCELKYGTGMAPDIAANRIQSKRYYDPEINVILLEKKSGKKIIFYHFACHPTILHADNLQVSADFPGAANHDLEQMEGVDMAFFLNGPSGDISTRFTRKESSFREVSRIGKKLAGYVHEILNKSKQMPVPYIRVNKTILRLHTRPGTNKAVLTGNLQKAKQKYAEARKEDRKTAAIRSVESEIEGLTAAINRSEQLNHIIAIDTEVQIISIGGIHFTAVPGEMYFEDGRKITETFSGVLVLGNTNDYIGYIVPESHYGECSYETSMTLLEKGSAEKIISASKNLIRRHIQE